MNSRDKGKRGERELAALLREHGFDARRGQQFSGGADSPDVICELLDWLHIEVKRVERLNLIDACAQAEGDCDGKRWVVIHRRNHAPWLFTGRLEILLDFIRGVLPPNPKADAERPFGSFAPVHSAPVAPSPDGESISPLPKRLNSAAACVAATNQNNKPQSGESIPAHQQKEPNQ